MCKQVICQTTETINVPSGWERKIESEPKNVNPADRNKTNSGMCSLWGDMSQKEQDRKCSLVVQR